MTNFSQPSNVVILHATNASDITDQLYIPLTDFEFSGIKRQRFKNGEINVELNVSVRNKVVFILSRPTSYEDLFEIIFTADASRRAGAKEIIGIIPNLPHSRQERRDEKRTTISARVIADMLQTCGISRVITFDVHTNAIEGFYSIPMDKLYPTEIFIKEIQDKKYHDLMFVSPDLGAVKRTKIYAEQFNTPMAIINKERVKANQVDNMTLIGDVTFKQVIMVDDMIDTGGTLRKASELVMSRSALSVDLYATHGLLSGLALEKFEESPYINSVNVTNSLPKLRDRHKAQYSKLKYHDISPLILKTINKLV
jgi:ribose-phosphate pyrophosphokinase